MSNTTPSGASSALENVSVTDLAKHVQSLTDRVDDLEQEVAEKDERIDDLEQRVDQLEDYRTEAAKERVQDRQQLSRLEDTTETIEADIDDLTDAEEKNTRVRASVSRLINLVRDYETEKSVDDDSPNLTAEAANAGRQLFETVQCSEQNTELINFREKRAESQQVEDKYLDVLKHAKNVAKTNDVMVARLGYRDVATHYGCAYKNDGYRVMEEMAERVPGVSYKESRTLSVDDEMGVGGHHIEITFAHPDLAGWMRAHEANTGKNGGR
jgi:vacuolar-type H+-ATPase subunit I/STV1